MGKNKLNYTGRKYLATNPDVDIVKIKTERNSLGTLKTVLVLLGVALQFCLLVLAYHYLLTFFKWFTIVSIVFSFIACIYVLSSNKNSQSKPIWVFFLLICPTFSYLIYIGSSVRVFWGKRKKIYNKILERSYAHIGVSNCEIKNKEIENECKYLQKAGNFVSYTNTDTKYFPSGASLFDDVLAELERAERFIFIEYYIIANGILLNKFLTILKEKVKQGVDVRIIYDDFGSHGSLKRATKKEIKNAGIKLFTFNKVLPQFKILYNFRDHRKIVVIDGKVAYTGGANLADEYVNEKRSHGYWKDAGVRIKGPAVDGFTLMFLRQWEFVSKQEVSYEKYLRLSEPTNNSSVVVPYADGLDYPDNIGKNAYTNLIANANEKLYIMSPYLVVDDTITNLLINKAKSGVDVRIILPGIADKQIVYIVSRNSAEKLIESGVKVYTMKSSFVHSKVLLNENDAIIGTMNMDLRSFYQQFECAVLLNDKNTLVEIENDFRTTFEQSVLIDETNKKRNKFLFRVVAGIVNLVSPFM
ncbi:MAG: cardiolipin synthase [Clostridiales bacterium]|nr:cardiolipin synthase [Clostridiales bacterium]